jgi:hypothetical protein|nr:MAG TPA: hypothetical protein [Caudoviricetes sp.]
MQLKFEGQTSSIDAGTLINILMQYRGELVSDKFEDYD